MVEFLCGILGIDRFFVADFRDSTLFFQLLWTFRNPFPFHICRWSGVDKSIYKHRVTSHFHTEEQYVICVIRLDYRLRWLTEAFPQKNWMYSKEFENFLFLTFCSRKEKFVINEQSVHLFHILSSLLVSLMSINPSIFEVLYQIWNGPRT